MQISQRENGMCEIIDIHTHILPETDDGARGIQESIQLIEQKHYMYLTVKINFTEQ